jgi:hypothetical protein
MVQGQIGPAGIDKVELQPRRIRGIDDEGGSAVSQIRGSEVGEREGRHPEITGPICGGIGE